MRRSALARRWLGATVLLSILSWTALAPSAARGQGAPAAPGFFYDCGTLVPGAEGCVLFNSARFGSYQLSDLGGFQGGDRVFVVGDLRACYSPCFPAGCITVDTIRPCEGTDLPVAAPTAVSLTAGTLLSVRVGVVGSGLIWVEADLSDLPSPNSASFSWIPPGVIGPSERGRGTFAWTPSAGDVRAEPYAVTFLATGPGRTGSATTFVRVDAAATIDLVPRVLNQTSQGQFVTAFIRLPSRIAPESIDLSTIRLEETIPAYSKFGVVGNVDGEQVPSLMVKFERSRIVALGAGEHTLRLTGSLDSGVRFAGVAEVRVTQPSGSTAAGPAPRILSRPGAVPVELSVPGTDSGPLLVRVFDVRGHLVTAWAERSSHPVRVRWNGGTADGAAVRSGVYFVEVSAAGRRGVAKAVVVR